MLTNAARLLLVGGILAAIGLVLVLLFEGTANGIGLVFFAFACLPTVAGLAIGGSALISRRARAGKPFA